MRLRIRMHHTAEAPEHAVTLSAVVRSQVEKMRNTSVFIQCR